ncbi:hypothetical protein BJY01DRAFT_251343 [Aspergillus pseudoustus]|uniref:Uncharacterized protein n=1 Tax=Aspergillus pseudoustus TaxID=1810923 RepID=A0ABR4JC53_9EURO
MSTPSPHTLRTHSITPTTLPTNTLTLTYMKSSKILILGPRPPAATTHDTSDGPPTEVPCTCLTVRGRLVICEEKILPFPMPGPMFPLAIVPAGANVVREIEHLLTAAVARNGPFWYETFLRDLHREIRLGRREGYMVTRGAAGDLARLLGHVEEEEDEEE